LSKAKNRQIRSIYPGGANQPAYVLDKAIANLLSPIGGGSIDSGKVKDFAKKITPAAAAAAMAASLSNPRIRYGLKKLMGMKLKKFE